MTYQVTQTTKAWHPPEMIVILYHASISHLHDTYDKSHSELTFSVTFCDCGMKVIARKQSAKNRSVCISMEAAVATLIQLPAGDWARLQLAPGCRLVNSLPEDRIV